MPAVTKITAKYQVTLPREVRQALRAQVGDFPARLCPTDRRLISGTTRSTTLDSAALRLAGPAVRLLLISSRSTTNSKRAGTMTGC